MAVGSWIVGAIFAIPTFGASLSIPAAVTIAGTTMAVAGLWEYDLVWLTYRVTL